MEAGIGGSFAGYTIESVLGQGGMGTVYLARHPRLPRSVALKLVNRDVSADPEVRRRFEQEGNVVARLDHPGIVGIYDRGADNGHLWIAMQYIRGSDVAKLDPRSMTLDRALRIVTQTAAALDHAHAQGVLHRDVKPANILLAQSETGREERAVLTDFGIARMLDSSTKLTATGTFTATLAYASPEQLSAEHVDHRADQYSLACTLFALLAGQTPYANTSPGQVVAGHLSKPVPQLRNFRSDLPPALDQVFARALAKNREERFGSCGEFAAAASDALAGKAVPIPAYTGPTVVNQAATALNPAATVVNPAAQMAGHQLSGLMYQPDPAEKHMHGGRPYQAVPAQARVVPAPRRKSPAFRILAGIGAVVVLVAAGVFVQRDAITAWINRWDDEHQVVANAFPNLLAEAQFAVGWLGATCYSTSYMDGRVVAIRCSNNDTGISYQVKMYGSEAEAAATVDSFVRDRAADQVVTHPSAGGQVTVTIEPPTPGTFANGVVYTRFPDDEQRSRFVFEIEWANHHASDVFEQWWPQAPLGAGTEN
ncbi:serine/threonine-protein kinase [Nocardia sp. NPDC058499]|uniref:serine/threonine-protein kinase n=1 Tax=Nocardia sp. NPDC058499 TaxID=3346530 RepID=UPI00365C3BD8